MLTRLDAAICRHTATAGPTTTRVPRQSLVRYDTVVDKVDMTYTAMLCVVAAGRKKPQDPTDTSVGAGQMLLSLADVPIVASFDAPYRSATLELDFARVASLALEGPPATPVRFPRDAAHVVAPVDTALLDAMCRWVELLDTPADIAVLASRYEDEILYRLLRSSLGSLLRHATSTSRHDVVGTVIARIGREYADQSLHVAGLVKTSGMSESAFFENFRNRTSLTPNQYLKRVRLQHARRLIASGETAARAATLVGYVSPAHFSRDYTAQYGMSPRRHAQTAGLTT